MLMSKLAAMLPRGIAAVALGSSAQLARRNREDQSYVACNPWFGSSAPQAEAAAPAQVKAPTGDELKQYHSLMARLKDVDGLEAATAFDNASVYWDFKLKSATPGRIWHETSPDWLKQEMLRRYTPEEIQACRDVSGIDKIRPRPVGEQPICVIVIGPGAAGKSTALDRAAKTLDIEVDEFAMMDGDDFRDCHAGWRKHIIEEKVHGYKDAFDIFRENPDMKMKERLMDEALKARKNLIVPINKSKPGMVKRFKENDYKVYVLAMLVSSSQSKVRCINRANENGRYPPKQKKAYIQCLDDVVDLCKPEVAEKVVVIDSTDFANMKIVFSRVHDFSDVEKLARGYQNSVSDAH